MLCKSSNTKRSILSFIYLTVQDYNKQPLFTLLLSYIGQCMFFSFIYPEINNSVWRPPMWRKRWWWTSRFLRFDSDLTLVHRSWTGTAVSLQTVINSRLMELPAGLKAMGEEGQVEGTVKRRQLSEVRLSVFKPFNPSAVRWKEIF